MRLSQLTLRVFALCAALFCNRAAQADETVATSPEKIELRIHAQKGQTYDRIMAMYQKTSQTIQGKRYDVNVTMRFDLRSEVLDISPAGDTHVRQTYRRVQFSMDTPRTNSNAVPTNFTLRYDSARPPKILPAEAAVMAALAGQSLIYTISPTGKVLKTEGMEEFVERVIAKIQPPVSVRAELRKQIKDQMSEQAQKSSGTAARFPDQPVGIGEKWQSDLPTSSVLPFAISSEYSLLARNNGIARISIVSKFSPNSKTGPQIATDFPAKVVISGVQNGIFSVDEKTGYTQSFEMRQRTSGKITGTPPGQKTQSWPIYISSTMRGWTVTPIQK